MRKEKSKEDIYKVLFLSFMKISNGTVSSKQNFIEKYNLFTNFKALLRFLSSCYHVSHLLNHYKTLKQLLQETLVWVILGRVFFAYNHSFPLQGFYFFIVFFLVFLNQISKFLFFCQTILFFTSNDNVCPILMFTSYSQTLVILSGFHKLI